MVDATSRILTFDYGIERLLQERDVGDAVLPGRGQIAPSAVEPRPRLDEIVQPRSFDDLVQDFLRPSVADREILTPARYEALLGSSLEKLRALAADGDPAITDAAALLEQEQALRRELDEYRNMLVKG